MAATEITPPQPQSEFTKISSQSETATENNEASKYDLTALVAAINITDEMDLTSTTVDLTGVDGPSSFLFSHSTLPTPPHTEDLKAFQEDPLVKAALDKNVNLGEYSKKIENDLVGIEMDSMNDCSCKKMSTSFNSETSTFSYTLQISTQLKMLPISTVKFKTVILC